ncbi:GNAT family N-acetyltransferase [Phenylobacterium sp.]|uniref:GNAT family N-acetyltransferase n=1 Tax=Phenylobacterium sp. TaxID=1871053 RepID=UPI002736A8D6|nr:GNAT family N-acetyltransferase [Phenylobacterium sp.]MDP3854619.1 GNAT family N-acetyltransferase [Phenylobacterium sp.]
MSAAPVIETERLILRGHVKADLDECFAMWGDAEVTRYIGGKPAAVDEVWSRLLRYIGHWDQMDYGFWTVREKAGGRFVGEVGFADFKRQMSPSFGDAPEMGWVLSPAAHGRGYATEAVNAALAWADQRFATGRTVCMISPENAPSLRVAAKAGFREFARTNYHDDVILLERGA